MCEKAFAYLYLSAARLADNKVSVIGQASVLFFEALQFEFCISGNVNKMRVLLPKMRDLQGFRRKKRPCRFYSTRSIFLLWFYKLGLPQIKYHGKNHFVKNSCPGKRPYFEGLQNQNDNKTLILLSKTPYFQGFSPCRKKIRPCEP